MPYEFLPKHLADEFRGEFERLDEQADALEARLTRVNATPPRHTITYESTRKS